MGRVYRGIQCGRERRISAHNIEPAKFVAPALALGGQLEPWREITTTCASPLIKIPQRSGLSSLGISVIATPAAIGVGFARIQAVLT
jgi:hypothetical protein